MKVYDQYAALATQTTLTLGASAEETSTLGLGGATLEISEPRSHKETVTTDAKGNTRGHRLGKGLGYNLSVPYLPKRSGKTTDTFTGRVEPDRRATGEASSVRSNVDFGKSLGVLQKEFDEAPLTTIVTAVTGGGAFLKERTDTRGTKISDADYERLVELDEALQRVC